MFANIGKKLVDLLVPMSLPHKYGTFLAREH